MKKHIGIICQVLKHGAHLGVLQANPSLGFGYQGRNKSKTPAYLTSSELQAIQTTRYTHYRMRACADVFLFLCYTGLSNVDYLRFRADKHLHESMGYTFIRMRRQKSNKGFSAWLQPEALEILVKYDQQLPVFNNDSFNDCLLRVRRLAGISQHLTTGLARHTFSQRLRDLGFSDEGASSQAGHTVEVMNERYSSISEQRIVQELERLQGKPGPTLVDQLRAALLDPSQAEALRQMLRGDSEMAA